jgi:phage terminase large subunit GpA-like protein
MNPTLDGIRKRVLAALVPPPRLRLAEWMERNIELPEGVSALPGAVRLWPYQRDIADAIFDPAIERVTLVKSVRLGFTTLLTGALGGYVANDPSPIIALLPTEADCRDYIVSDVEPVFEASPALRGMLSADLEEGSRNTLLHRRFPGGSLKVIAAKAPRNLRRHNARVLLVDEADGMEAGREGSPIRLAERRTLSFPNRKIVIGSTPLLEETSNVLRSYATSDQRVFEVPCPACGAFTEILWDHITWEPDRPETARFACPHCRAGIAERHKSAMVEAGRWRITHPEITGHAGFRMNALVSLLANAAWPKLVAEFLAARESPDELQTFVNTILAQGWREAGEQLDDSVIQSRAEPFGLDAIPPEVLAVTCGVDVQDDRLEVTLCGWSRTEAFILAHLVIWGGPGDDTTWAELDELLRTRWRHPFGGFLKVDATVIDSGDGEWTDKVYSFCFPRLGRRIMAGKGVFGTRPAIQASAGKVKGGRLFLVGVDGLKGQIMHHLARGTLLRFSHTLEPIYFEQLTSERKVLRYSRGQPVRRFERKTGARAETLDCLVYAMAARQATPVMWDRREEELRSEMPPAPPPTTIRSAWLGR